MRKVLFSALALGLTALTAQAASAQDTTTPDSNPTFRGIRIEGNVGGDRFQSQGHHNDKFGFGGTVGFDGVIGNKIVIGPEGSYWHANDGNENCSGGRTGGTICEK